MKKLWLVLLIAFPVHAQIALISHAAVQSTSSSPTTTTAINTTGANFLMACSIGNPPLAAPVDNKGNTWVLDAQSLNSAANVSVWHSFPTSVGTGHTVTFNSDYPSGTFASFSGVASGPDKNETAKGSTTPFPIGSLTPSNAGELVFSCFASNFGSATTPTIASPMSILDAAGITSTAQGIGDGYQIQTTSSAVNPTWSLGTGFTTGTATSYYSAANPATLATTITSLPEGFVSTAYSATLTQTGGAGPYTWSLVSGTLPAGLSIVSGVLQGTPTATVSATPLIFRVTDSQSHTANTPTIPLTIAATQPSITTSTCPSGTQYVTYAGCTLAGTGGTSPYTFIFNTAPPLIGIPAGLTVNASTGAISGTMQGQGVFDTTYVMTDSLGASVSKIIPISVNGDNTFGGNTLFPAASIFRGGLDITGLPVDTSPAAPTLPGSIHIVFGSDILDGGIPMQSVSSAQAAIPVACPNDGTAGCYQHPVTSAPFSSGTPIEGTQNDSNASNYIGDGHAIVYQPGSPSMLYESFSSQYIPGNNSWANVSNFSWDMTSYTLTNGAGSADAAGLPIAPFLANYDRVVATGGQTTPIRFTLPGAQTLNYHVWPATAQAGGGSCSGGYSDPTFNQLQLQSNPPTSCSAGRVVFGEIYRIKASSFTSPSAACLTDTAGHPQASSIFKTMRKYGIINADNGLGIGLIGTSDARWNDADLSCLTALQGTDFEPVNMSSVIVSQSSSQVMTAAPSANMAITGASSITGKSQ